MRNWGVCFYLGRFCDLLHVSGERFGNYFLCLARPIIKPVMKAAKTRAVMVV